MRRKRRQRRISPTLFEELPNEILIEILSYLMGVDAIHAFSSLNPRFSNLLADNCESFNFQSISKSQFDLIRQSQNTKLWKSLTISDDEHTPNHVEYFCKIYSLINDFPRLLSLAVIKLDLRKTYRIFSQISSLKNLSSLTLKPVCGHRMPVLDLPNLNRFVFSACPHLDWIKDLPRLKSVEYTTVSCHWFSDNAFVWPSTIQHLQMIFDYERFYDFILYSTVNLSSLTKLEIYQTQPANTYPNGQLWESSIRSSLSSLKIFKFYFPFTYSPDHSPDQIDQMIRSFSTPFYIHEKQWFVRCDLSYRYRTFLYSLPFPFGTYTALQGTNIRSLSTLMEEDKNASLFSSVKTLEVLYKTSEPNETFHTNQVTSLILYNDFNSFTWMPVLKKLQRLEMNVPLTMSADTFHHLLKNAPHLHSITTEKRLLQLATEHWNHVSICNYLSRQILSLKLCARFGRSRCTSNHEIQQLIRIFSSKCQHLSLCIQMSNDTIGLILNQMSQLRSLHVNISGKTQPTIDWTSIQSKHSTIGRFDCLTYTNENDHYFWL